jgi:hypothetical protein
MWDSIKKILEKQGGTCIIVEDGKPKYVVTAFEEFQRLLEKEEISIQKPASNLSEQELLEKINQDIATWRAAQAEEQAEPELAAEETDGGIRIEDLPV